MAIGFQAQQESHKSSLRRHGLSCWLSLAELDVAAAGEEQHRESTVAEASSAETKAARRELFGLHLCSKASLAKPSGTLNIYCAASRAEGLSAQLPSTRPTEKALLRWYALQTIAVDLPGRTRPYLCTAYFQEYCRLNAVSLRSDQTRLPRCPSTRGPRGIQLAVAEGLIGELEGSTSFKPRPVNYYSSS